MDVALFDYELPSDLIAQEPAEPRDSARLLVMDRVQGTWVDRRFSDLPAIETVLVDRKDLPSAGAGETPIMAVAPAIGNAIFHATGTRLRGLPMVPDGLKTARS